MGDEELACSNVNVYEVPGCSTDSIFEGLECRHVHTCNPPGPGADLPHTHSCFHMHTQVLSGPDTDHDETANCGEKKPKKGNNKESSLKYRRKKKAQESFMKDEAKRLEAENQQLKKRVEELEAVLEAQTVRFTCLLVDMKGRIEGEMGSFPYQKPVNPNTILPAAYPCNNQFYGLNPGGVGRGALNACCDFGQPMHCFANQGSGLNFEDPPGT